MQEVNYRANEMRPEQPTTSDSQGYKKPNYDLNRHLIKSSLEAYSFQTQKRGQPCKGF